MADSGGAPRPELKGAAPPLRGGIAARKPRGGRQAAPLDNARPGGGERASAQAQRAVGAALAFDAGGRDPADLTQASAELWAALFIDEGAAGQPARSFPGLFPPGG